MLLGQQLSKQGQGLLSVGRNLEKKGLERYGWKPGATEIKSETRVKEGKKDGNGSQGDEKKERR